MLVLSRKINQSIMIGDEVEIMIVDIKQDQVKIGIAAPKNVKVYRKEIYDEIQRANVAASTISPSILQTMIDRSKKLRESGDQEPTKGTGKPEPGKDADSDNSGQGGAGK